jgi:acetyl esterase/lipase
MTESDGGRGSATSLVIDRSEQRAAAKATVPVRSQRNGSRPRAPLVAAVVAVTAILAISLYSAYTIERVMSSSAPNVGFTLGAAHRNLTYCNSQTLDLYIPDGAAVRPLPLAIFVHGGGMTAGDKANINPVFLNALAAAGYAVASVNYRLAPQFKFPAQIEDVKCAIRYLRDNARTYGLSGSEIFAFGTSVGGQLVALAALTGSQSAFDVGPYLNEPSSVTAVADIFGPANLTEGGGYSATGVLRVFGRNDKQSDLELASPTHYVAANSPPILIIQGVNDATVPESQSIELYHDLKAAGDQTQLVLVQNMGHMFVQVGAKPIDPSLGQIAQDMVDFFNRSTEGR